MSEIRGLLVAADRRPMAIVFEDKLDNYQTLVSGNIEALGLNDKIDLIVNECGKFDGSLANRLLHYNDFDYIGDCSNKPYDVIYGTFLVIGADNEVGEWRSLTDEEIKYYSERFHDIEIFLANERGMIR